MPEALESLQQIYQDYFLLGAAVSSKTLCTSEELILKHFGSITAENAMKFGRIHPASDRYDFREADAIVDFARTHGKQIRGHTLVWHNQVPDWVFLDDDGCPVSRGELMERMQSHIYTVMGRYRGHIDAWDVVNEAIEDRGSSYLRQSKWLQIIGPDYVARAFEFAHAADPEAVLLYNDYNETNSVKRQKMIHLVQELQDQGVPIHGIGLQAHWSIYHPSMDSIRAALDDYLLLGLPIHFTELDLSMFRFEDPSRDCTWPTREMLERQAQVYGEIFALLRDYHQHIASVTLWGVADDHTWLDDFPVRSRKNWPLLFDEEHRPKASFDRVVEFSKGGGSDR